MLGEIDTRRRDDGFSLIELLVAVVIVAIIAAVAIPIFMNQRAKAADSVVTSDVRSLADKLATTIPNSNTATWTGLGSSSGSLVIDGVTQSKQGVLVYADSATGSWCVSKLSPETGKIFAAASGGSTGAYEATGTCTSASSVPTAGTTSLTLVSAQGNLMTTNQSSVETDLTGITGYNSTLSRSTAQARHGAASVMAVAGGAGDGFTAGVISASPLGDKIPVTAGTTYTAVVSTRAHATPRNFIVRIAWYNNSNVKISEIGSTPVMNTTSGWTQASVTATAPAGATRAAIVASWSGYSNGDVQYADAYGLWEGSGGTWAPPGEPVYSG